MKKLLFKTLAAAMCIVMLAGTLTFTGSAKSLDFSFDPVNLSFEAPFKSLLGEEKQEIGLNSAEPQKANPHGSDADVLYTNYDIWGNLDKAYVCYVKNSCTGTVEIVSEIEGFKVIGIGETAFSGSKVSKVVIPDTISDINETAFAGCKELKEIVVDSNNPYYKSHNGALYNKSMTKLIYVPAKAVGTSFEIPEGVKDISMGAFADCSNFALTIPSTIYFPNNVDFLDCVNVTEFRVNSNPYVTAKDGVLMDKRGTAILKYPISSSRKAYTIPEGIRECAETAFYSLNVDAELAIEDIIPYTDEISIYAKPSNLFIIIQDYSADYFDYIAEAAIVVASHIAVCNDEWTDEFVDEINAEYKARREELQAEADAYLSTLTPGSAEYIELKLYVDYMMSALNCHLAYWTAHDEPDCYDGSDSFECFCGFKHTESIAAHGHDFNAWRISGSGYARSCNVCGNANAEIFTMKAPSVTEVKYGETLILHIDSGTAKPHDGCAVIWEVSGSGASIAPSEDGLTCEVTCVDNGTVTVTAKLVNTYNHSPEYDENGNEISVSQELTMKGGFFWKIISFFKDLFRISRVIAQFT